MCGSCKMITRILISYLCINIDIFIGVDGNQNRTCISLKHLFKENKSNYAVSFQINQILF